MPLLSRLFLPLVSAFVILFAINPFGMPVPYVYIIAAVTTAVTAFARSSANGIFVALLFSFAFYSFHGTEWKGLLINTVVLVILSVSAESIRNIKRAESTSKKEPDEKDKVFMNKVLNSLMFAHDMLWQLKNSNDTADVRRIFSGNMMTIMSVTHVVSYKQDETGRMRAVFSAGRLEHGNVMQETSAESFDGFYGKSIPAAKCPVFSGVDSGYCLCVPLKDKNGIKEVTVFHRREIFDESDVYIAEFFAAQVFVIIEKHELFARLSDNYEKIIEALSIAIDTKDHETHGHSLATMFYAMRIAEKLGLADTEVQKIRYASLLHDIGKINISSKILNKPSSLTEEEFDIIKKHPKEGVGILTKLNIFDEIIPIILYHHERYDGKGYPENLKGESIPLGSRICAIADAYSVMRSDRPYRKALTKDAAVTELKKCAGSQFDKSLVNVFLQVIDEEEKNMNGPVN